MERAKCFQTYVISYTVNCHQFQQDWSVFCEGTTRLHKYLWQCQNCQLFPDTVIFCDIFLSRQAALTTLPTCVVFMPYSLALK